MSNLENKYDKYDSKQINTSLNATTHHISLRKERKRIFSLPKKIEICREQRLTKSGLHSGKTVGSCQLLTPL